MTRWFKRIALALVACSLAMLVAVSTLWASRLPAFAIHRVVVTGELKEVNPAHLEAVAREALRTRLGAAA